MIKNENFICISSADWDNPYWTNQQHIMSRLARHNKVLYIESLGLRRPVLQRKDFKRIIRRLRRFVQGPIKINDKLYTYSPFLLPFYKFRVIRRLNHLILTMVLKKLIKKLELDKPIIWSYVPNAVYLKDKLGSKLVVYHCVDEIAANPLIPGKVVLEMEKKLLAEADLVFTTSRELYQSKKRQAKNIYYLPNVADVEPILKINTPAVEVPADVAGLPRPRLGFIGAISGYKLDFELLRQMACSHPEWSIVMIGTLGEGEKSVQIATLRELPNLHFLGGRPYNLLANYLKSFDVCLLPCCLNEYTRNMFPLKFFEYLAAGKPVVSTALPSLAEFKEYFYWAESTPDFIAKIGEALKENATCQSVRIDLAKKYSWTVRMEEISKLIEGKIFEKSKFR